jgi:phosphoribosylamine--glycine ligase
VHALAEENRPLVGFLYAGLILTGEGPRVLEFNVRLGDPEAQPLLLRLEDDLAELLLDGARGAFRTDRLHFRHEAAACVVLASAGYPDDPVKGELIGGLDEAAQQEGVVLFHAGTALEAGKLVSAGGRVLDVCATGADLREALRHAYEAAAMIAWPHRILRSDIGRRVVERLG